MTREEASKLIKTEEICWARSSMGLCNWQCESCELLLNVADICEAFNIAIEALQERPKGRWIKDRYCSNCEHDCECLTTNFCPNCGSDNRADMRGERECQKKNI